MPKIRCWRFSTLTTYFVWTKATTSYDAILIQVSGLYAAYRCTHNASKLGPRWDNNLTVNNFAIRRGHRRDMIPLRAFRPPIWNLCRSGALPQGTDTCPIHRSFWSGVHNVLCLLALIAFKLFVVALVLINPLAAFSFWRNLLGGILVQGIRGQANILHTKLGSNAWPRNILENCQNQSE